MNKKRSLLVLAVIFSATLSSVCFAQEESAPLSDNKNFSEIFRSITGGAAQMPPSEKTDENSKNDDNDERLKIPPSQKSYDQNCQPWFCLP